MLSLSVWKQDLLSWAQFPHQRTNPMYLLEVGEAALLAPNGPHAVSPDYRLTAVWFFPYGFPKQES